MLCGVQFREYLDRAEYIKSMLDGEVTVQHTNGSTQKARPPGAPAAADKDSVSGAPDLY